MAVHDVQVQHLRAGSFQQLDFPVQIAEVALQHRRGNEGDVAGEFFQRSRSAHRVLGAFCLRHRNNFCWGRRPQVVARTIRARPVSGSVSSPSGSACVSGIRRGLSNVHFDRSIPERPAECATTVDYIEQQYTSSAIAGGWQGEAGQTYQVGKTHAAEGLRRKFGYQACMSSSALFKTRTIAVMSGSRTGFGHGSTSGKKTGTASNGSESTRIPDPKLEKPASARFGRGRPGGWFDQRFRPGAYSGCRSPPIRDESRTLELGQISKLSDQTTSLLQRLRTGDGKTSPESIAAILEAVEALKESIVGIEATGEETELNQTNLLSRLQRLAKPQREAAEDTRSPINSTMRTRLSRPNDRDGIEQRAGRRPAGQNSSYLVNSQVPDHLMHLVDELRETRASWTCYPPTAATTPKSKRSTALPTIFAKQWPPFGCSPVSAMPPGGRALPLRRNCPVSPTAPRVRRNMTR